MEKEAKFIIVEVEYGKHFKIAIQLSSFQILSGIEGPSVYGFLAETYFPTIAMSSIRTNNFSSYKDAVEAYRELVEGGSVCILDV